MLTVSQTSEMLKKADRVLIICHAHPDGDTLGCGFALCKALQNMGKMARVHCEDALPEMFAYLKAGIKEEEFDEAFVVAVDVASLKLLGSETEARYSAAIDLCIDHHASNTGYAKNLCLEPDAPAASELMWQLFKAMGVTVDKAMADCLYTGICTDTGCFRYADVRPETHRIAAELMELGAAAAEINVKMFETKSRNHLRLECKTLEDIEFFFDGKCALIVLTQELFRETGTGEEDVDAISAMPRQIAGVLVGVTLREKADGSFKASVRTHDPVSAAEICRKLGGGGHVRASGCQFECSLDEAKSRLLSVVGEAVKGL